MKHGFVIALSLALALAISMTGAAPTPALGAASMCPVTIPTRSVPRNAGFTAAGFNYGGRHLRAELYWPNGIVRAGRLPNGGYVAFVNPDGSIRLKVGWWRGVPGRLRIGGRRLDAHAPPLRSEVGNDYGYGFEPSAVVFPTVGCWRVVGRVQHVRLAWVVKVTKVRPS